MFLLFNRIPSVTHSNGRYHVHGSAYELLQMCTACIKELERRGMDPMEVWRSLWAAATENIKETEDEDNGDNADE